MSIIKMAIVMGVRLPELRKIAKKIAKGDWPAYLAEAENEWFEEVMLQGMVLGYVQGDIEEVLRHITDFVRFCEKRQKLSHFRLPKMRLIVPSVCWDFYLSEGLGLTANQIGWDKLAKHSPEIVYLENGEGCLSVDREVRGYVSRNNQIVVQALHFSVSSQGMSTRCQGSSHCWLI